MTEPPVTVPVCYRHPSRETYVRCTRCERPICPDCMTEASVGFQCPECVAEGRRTVRPALTAFGGGSVGRAGYVTRALIGLNVLVALLGVVLSGVGALIGGGLFTGVSEIHAFGATTADPWTVTPIGEVARGAYPDFGTVYPGISDGGFYRLFTAMFIHYGILHLLLNMYAVWIIGRQLEAVLGPVRFLALYLLAGIGGNVFAYLLSPESLSAGASTAVFGLFAAYFVILRRLRRDTSAIAGLLVVNIVLSFTFARFISWEGHLGGLVFGAAVAAVLAYAPRGRRTLVQAAGCGVVFLALIGLALVGPIF